MSATTEVPRLVANYVVSLVVSTRLGSLALAVPAQPAIKECRLNRQHRGAGSTGNEGVSAQPAIKGAGSIGNKGVLAQSAIKGAGSTSNTGVRLGQQDTGSAGAWGLAEPVQQSIFELRPACGDENEGGLAEKSCGIGALQQGLSALGGDQRGNGIECQLRGVGSRDEESVGVGE